MEESIFQVLLSQSFPVLLLGVAVWYFHRKVEKMEAKIDEKEKAWLLEMAKIQTERSNERAEFIRIIESVKHVIEENTHVIQKLDESSRTKKVREAV
jgi:hypothetical protein